MEANFGASQNSGAMPPSVPVKTPLMTEIGKREGERRKIEGVSYLAFRRSVVALALRHMLGDIPFSGAQ